MSEIDIIAAIFAIFILLKVTIILINPNRWLKLADSFLKNKILTSIVYLLLAVIVGYFVFLNMSIKQIAAVMLFTSLLIGISMIPFSKTMLSIYSESLRTRSDMLRKTWLSLFIWVTIAALILYTIFVKA